MAARQSEEHQAGLISMMHKMAAARRLVSDRQQWHDAAAACDGWHDRGTTSCCHNIWHMPQCTTDGISAAQCWAALQAC